MGQGAKRKGEDKQIMARYTGPKDRLSRREGTDLFGKGAKLTRINVIPGQHGARRAGRVSTFGKQLREKQKAKRMYGILEKQFKTYVTKALSSRGNTGDKLLSLLETRLDNVIYRLNFAPTRPAARQLVSHNHVFINKNVVNIPSYKVKVGDVVTLSAKAQAIPAVKKLLESKGTKIVSWLEKKAAAGKIKRIPESADVVEPISVQDIVEFYSR